MLFLKHHSIQGFYEQVYLSIHQLHQPQHNLDSNLYPNLGFLLSTLHIQALSLKVLLCHQFLYS